MKSQATFVCENLVLRREPPCVTAVYRVAHRRGDAATLDGISGLVAADLSLLRVSRAWAIDDYSIGVEAAVDVRYAHCAELKAHLTEQCERLAKHALHTVETYVTAHVSRVDDDLVRRCVNGSGPARRLLLRREGAVQARLAECLGVAPASAKEVKALTQRAFTRGVEPPALPGPVGDRVLRIDDAAIDVHPSSIRVKSAHGESWQAFLCPRVGSVKRSSTGRQIEKLLAPLEELPFPVDVGIALRPDPHSVRHHPPDICMCLSLCVPAPSAAELAHRVERLRAGYAAMDLRWPLGHQLRLFVANLPGRRARVRDVEEDVSGDQLGGILRTATCGMVATTGPCIGTTSNTTRRPVRFDPADGRERPLAVLAGVRGSGKTLCMQLITYQAFLTGSTIVEVDIKGDHALERLPGVAGHVEVLDISASEHAYGLLDPLRVGPIELRERLACDFLLSVLPQDAPAAWQREVCSAVRTVVLAHGQTCEAVISELMRRSRDARAAADALVRRSSASALARLGFTRAQDVPRDVVPNQITSLRAGKLMQVRREMFASDTADEHRLGRAVCRLAAGYALGIASADRRRPALLAIDDAWGTLSDRSGLELIGRMARLGRSRNVTALVATPTVRDVEQQLGGLLGPVFCFGAQSNGEATQAARLLGVESQGGAVREQLAALQPGRCFMRDDAGSVSAVQVELEPGLLRALGAR